MNWYKIFYLMTMADRLQTFFLVMGIISGIIGGVAFIIYIGSFFEDDSATKKLSMKWIILFWPVIIIAWTCWIVTPSKKDALIIIAGGAVGEFVTSDSSAQKLPADITRFLRAKIQDETKSLTLESLVEEKVDTLKTKTKEELIQLLRRQGH